MSVYFDFDENELTADARSILETNASCALKLGVRIRVTGHTDERGADEYNLALGERRATSVKTFLNDAGVTSPIETLSYGEEMPVCTDPGEECHAKNRRAEFVPRP